MRAPASHKCGPGLIPEYGVMWVEFVVSVSCLFALRVFLWVFWFSSPLKNQHNDYKFQFFEDIGAALKPAKADLAHSLNIVIYLIIYIYLFYYLFM